MAESEAEHDAAPSSPPDEETSERGTVVLAMLFIAAMAGMWSVVYFLMIERGG